MERNVEWLDDLTCLYTTAFNYFVRINFGGIHFEAIIFIFYHIRFLRIWSPPRHLNIFLTAFSGLMRKEPWNNSQLLVTIQRDRAN
jgi:hypothetical protein